MGEEYLDDNGEQNAKMATIAVFGGVGGALYSMLLYPSAL